MFQSSVFSADNLQLNQLLTLINYLIIIYVLEIIAIIDLCEII